MRTDRSSRTPSASRSCRWRGSPGWRRRATSRRSCPVRRAEWVTANAESLRELLEPAAQRIGEAMDRATREQLAAGDAADGRVHGPALATADGHAGGTGARVPRAAGAGAVRRGRAPGWAGHPVVRGAEHRDVREGLVARPDRVPDVGGAPRGDAPVRVRAPVGARTVPGAARRLPVDAHDRRGGDAGEARGAGRRRPRGAAGPDGVRRGAVRRRARRRAAAEARRGSRRSWPRPKGTATT